MNFHLVPVFRRDGCVSHYVLGRGDEQQTFIKPCCEDATCEHRECDMCKKANRKLGNWLCDECRAALDRALWEADEDD